MRLLVVGGTGLIGNALVRAWLRRGAQVAAATYHCHPSSAFQQLDMQDPDACDALLAETGAEVVAVPAANPHVDYCETHPEETRKVNVEGTLNVARACLKHNARMIFFSSDYVFDGSREVYTEADAPSPLNEYGRQKARTEAEVMALDSRNLVVRTSGAYGWQWEPKNFVLQIKARLESRASMNVAHDLRSNPTAVENLSEVVAELVDARASGIFQVVGADRLGRHEFAVRIAREFGLDPSLLRAVSSEEFNSPTLRPKSTSLSTAKVRAVARTPLWGVAEGLSQMRLSESAWRRYAETLPKPEPR